MAPYLLPGGTDSRHFVGLTPSVYRFAPLRVKPDDLARAHGIDERIGLGDLEDMVSFYTLLLMES